MGPDPQPDDPTPGMHIWGWMSPAELRWLGARAADMRSVVEVGSLHGRSAFALLTACPGPVVCIDPWNDDGGHCYPSFMGSCGHFENLIAVQDYSPGVAASVECEIGQPDMVFIDGLHDAESVRADVEGWLPIALRLICGHDYYKPVEDAGFPDVALVVDAIFGERVRVAPDTSIWYVEL